METDKQVRAMILDRLLSGRLPPRREHDLLGSYGERVRCVCCDKLIAKSQIQYDVDAHSRSGHLSSLSMHLDCYNMWAEASALVLSVLVKHGLPNILIGNQPASKQLFLIAYRYDLLVTRAALLRSRGYETWSALGNDAAKTALKADDQSYNLFIVGNAAGKDIRTEMASWLRIQYPETRILALNATGNQQLDDLKYNADDSALDVWLPMVATAANDRRMAT
jgi:hypothetical protein